MKHLIERQTKPFDKVFYHGSPTPNLEYLEPRLDPRLNKMGLFIDDTKYSPMAFSLMSSRYDTTVRTTTRKGEFIKGEIETKRPLNKVGYLYHIRITDKNDLTEYKPNRYLLNKK